MPKDTRRRDARWLPLHEMYLFLFHCDRKIWAYLGAVAAWYPFFPRLSACHLLVVWEKSASASLPPSSLTPCAQHARSSPRTRPFYVDGVLLRSCCVQTSQMEQPNEGGQTFSLKYHHCTAAAAPPAVRGLSAWAICRPLLPSPVGRDKAVKGRATD